MSPQSRSSPKAPVLIISGLVIALATALLWLTSMPQQEWPSWINGCRNSVMATTAKKCYVNLKPTDGLLWPTSAPDSDQLPTISTIVGTHRHQGLAIYDGPFQAKLDLRFPWAIISQEDYHYCIENPKRSLITNSQNGSMQWAISCKELPLNLNLGAAFPAPTF